MLCLAQQPLHRLQKLPGSSTSDPFLYDDSFLHDHVSRSTLRAHGDAIELKPGVAHGLARLAGLLKPALEIMWVDDVRRMNKFLDAEVPDVAGHLFGRERTALPPCASRSRRRSARTASTAGRTCQRTIPIDHVLPWSLVGIDGLANLVLACARCNGDKSGACRRCGSSTGCWSETETCWSRSLPRFSGRPSMTAWWRRPRDLSRATGRRADVVGIQADRTAGHQLPAVMDLNGFEG